MTTFRTEHENPPDPKKRPTSVTTRVLALATLLGAIAWCLLVATQKPADYPTWFRCPLLEHSGILCPGCGSTRATYALLNARPAESIRYNPLVIVLALPAVIAMLVAGVRSVLGSPPRRSRLPGSTGFIVLAIILVYWVARNIPISSLDILRPPAASGDAPGTPAEENRTGVTKLTHGRLTHEISTESATTARRD